MARHLLVTNDFPPKVGGIQNYLWELWRRLPASEVAVFTTPYQGDRDFDACQPFEVIRSRERWLLPGRQLVRQVNSLARSLEVELVIVDPALPAGLIGPHLDHPYAVVVHGAEAAIPARLPGLGAMLRRVLKGARGVISAGEYAGTACRRALGEPLDVHVVPPGVDVNRIRPLDDVRRAHARRSLGLHSKVPTVASVSRLVPRKGMDILIRATSLLVKDGHDVQVVIAGDGRDRRRLEALSKRLDAPVNLIGHVSEDRLGDVYGCADVFAMLCRPRWLGLEQEGFGIVFLEAAAAGIPQIAGRSGGAHEAVAHGSTGFVVDPVTPRGTAQAIGSLLRDQNLQEQMGAAARRRATRSFCYEVLSGKLANAISALSQQPTG